MPSDTIEEYKKAILNAANRMEQLGAEVIHHTDFDLIEAEVVKLKKAISATQTIAFKEDIESYMVTLVDSNVRTLEDLVNFNDKHAVRPL